MADIAVITESGNILSTLSVAPSTLQNLYDYRSLLVELYGRACTIIRISVDRRTSPRNGTTCPQFLIKLIKGEPEIVKYLNYEALASALERVSTNDEPIRICCREKFEDHNIRNL